MFQHRDYFQCECCGGVGDYASGVKHADDCELVRVYVIAALSDIHHKAAKAVDEAWERNR